MLPRGQGYRIWIIAVFGMTAANTAWRGVKGRSGNAAITEFASRFDALPGILIRVRAGNARRHSRHHILAIAFGTMRGGGPTGADRELCGHSNRELLQSCWLETGKRHPQS